MDYSFIYQQTGKDQMYKKWHSLKSNDMIMLVTNGCGNVVSHDKVYYFESGTLIFIGANVEHYTIPNDVQSYKRSKLFLPANVFAKFLSSIDLFGEVTANFSQNSLSAVKLPLKEYNYAKEIFNQLEEYQSTSKVNDFLLTSIISRLISFFIEVNSEKIPLSKNSHFIVKAISYINKNISKPIDVNDISNSVFLSKYYFCREFKRHIGLSVMQYVLFSRLSLAQEMLLSTALPLSEIAYRCGFSSLNYFSNAFKKENGVSPRQFRKSKLN